jgi:hypothetical protein
MSKVNVLLFWFRAPSKTEEPLLRRLDGIRGHHDERSEPRVPVFSRPEKQKAAAA